MAEDNPKPLIDWNGLADIPDGKRGGGSQELFNQLKEAFFPSMTQQEAAAACREHAKTMAAKAGK